MFFLMRGTQISDALRIRVHNDIVVTMIKTTARHVVYCVLHLALNTHTHTHTHRERERERERERDRHKDT